MEPQAPLPDSNTMKIVQDKVIVVLASLAIMLWVVVAVLAVFLVISPKQSQKIGDPCTCDNGGTGRVWAGSLDGIHYCQCGLSGT